MQKALELPANKNNSLRRIWYTTKNFNLLKTRPTFFMPTFFFVFTWKFLPTDSSLGLWQLLFELMILFPFFLLIFLSVASAKAVGTIKALQPSKNVNRNSILSIYLKIILGIVFAVATYLLLVNVIGLAVDLVFMVGISAVAIWFWWRNPNRIFTWYSVLALVVICLLTAITLIFKNQLGFSSNFDYQNFILRVGGILFLVIDASGDFILVNDVFRYKPRQDSFQETHRTEVAVPEKILWEVLTMLSACDSADLIILQRLTGIGEQTLTKMLTQLEDLGLTQIKREYHKSKSPTLFISITDKGRGVIL